MKKDLFLLFGVVGLGLVSLAVIVFLVSRGVQQEQRAKDSKAADVVDLTKCQGNPQAPARCFDCKKDASASSEINMLDFSCFKNYYGKTVGK